MTFRNDIVAAQIRANELALELERVKAERAATRARLDAKRTERGRLEGELAQESRHSWADRFIGVPMYLFLLIAAIVLFVAIVTPPGRMR